MVSAVIEWKESRREIRIAKDPIEIKHRVIFSACSNPRVDRLALDLLRRRKNRKRSFRDKKPFNRSERAAVNLEAVLTSQRDKLPEPLNSLVDTDLFSGIDRKHIVAPQLHDHVCHARSRERVPKTGESVGADGLMKDSATGNSFIHYPYLLIAWTA
jgi:hypothetical protein